VRFCENSNKLLPHHNDKINRTCFPKSLTLIDLLQLQLQQSTKPSTTNEGVVCIVSWHGGILLVKIMVTFKLPPAPAALAENNIEGFKGKAYNFNW